MDDISDQLTEAMNSHDPQQVAQLFADGYLSQQPAHPSRGFVGRDQVRENWTRIFDGVPDFKAERLGSFVDGDKVWTEVRWSGTHRDGVPFLMCGVTVLGVRDGKISWARLYVEPVDSATGRIADVVQEQFRPDDDCPVREFVRRTFWWGK